MASTYEQTWKLRNAPIGERRLISAHDLPLQTVRRVDAYPDIDKHCNMGIVTMTIRPEKLLVNNTDGFKSAANY
jgi:hypothetical protein